MGERITGHFELLYPSDYVKAADLNGRDLTVTIDHVEWDNIPQAGKSEKVKKPVVILRNAAGKPIRKKLAMGKTIARQIVDCLGEKDTAKWEGRKITLHGDTTRGTSGKTVECVRVRARVNERADAPPPSDPGPTAAHEPDEGPAQ